MPPELTKPTDKLYCPAGKLAGMSGMINETESLDAAVGRMGGKKILSLGFVRFTWLAPESEPPIPFTTSPGAKTNWADGGSMAVNWAGGPACAPILRVSTGSANDAAN